MSDLPAHGPLMPLFNQSPSPLDSSLLKLDLYASAACLNWPAWRQQQRHLRQLTPRIWTSSWRSCCRWNTWTVSDTTSPLLLMWGFAKSLYDGDLTTGGRRLCSRVFESICTCGCVWASRCVSVYLRLRLCVSVAFTLRCRSAFWCRAALYTVWPPWLDQFFCLYKVAL